ncbi:YihY/virulence factor BrkB family protein [Glaciihabitans sp. UYNi722]|uniref:YihY/virulence factor BrkB family protein n=1 Tax=Glaciihabitans sp. UYNi722 TaxID=3156344 RepID=UPI0033935122
MVARITALVAWVQKTRAARVFTRYSEKNGPILAGGLSLTALYSVFAGIFVGFAVLGLFIESDPALKEAVVSTLSTAVPGLIDTGNGGAIDLNALFASRVLNWSSIVALVALLVTALGWFASARSSVRAVFDLGPDKTFFLLAKLKDLGFVIAFAAVTIASAALSVFSTSALNFLFGLLGIDTRSFFALAVARVIGLLLVLVIDTVVLAALFRVLSDIRIPLNRLIPGSLIGGIALGMLKVLGATIIGGAGKNPLLASFAVILGLLVWFGLICQVILIAGTWIFIDMADHGQDAATLARRSGIVPPPRRLRPRSRPVSGGR